MKKKTNIEKEIYAYRRFVIYHYSNKKFLTLYWFLKYKYFSRKNWNKV